MAQTTQKYQIIQKVSENDTVLIHPETEAGVVKYDNTTSQLTATEVKGAIDELQSEINEISGGLVIGVKGNAESTYRTGQVNLTAANIGAEESGAVSTHNSNNAAHSDIRTAVTNAQTKADAAYSLAEGRSRGVSFATLAAAKTAISAAAKTDYKVGDTVYIIATGESDYWVSKVNDSKSGDWGYFELTELETKIDLTAYQTKTDNTLATTAKTVVGAIGEVKTTADGAASSASTNATEITKIKDGTTKVASATAADTAAEATVADKADKWTTARTIGVSVNSGKKTDDSTDITGSDSQSVDGSADKTIAVTLGDSGVAAGTYSAVKVNAKGIAVAGGQIIGIGTSGQTTPTAALASGGLFFKLIS